MEILTKFSDFLGESVDFGPMPDSDILNEAVNPALRKSLDELGANLKTDEDIVKAIEAAGLKRIPASGKERSADYAFEIVNSKDHRKYVSYTNGYVRAIWISGFGWSKGNTHMTPITRDKLSSSRDRLLLILRRALKLSGATLKSKPTSEKPTAERPSQEKSVPARQDSADREEKVSVPRTVTGILGLSKEDIATLKAKFKEEEKMMGESLKLIKSAVETEMKKFDDPSELISAVIEMLEEM